MERGTSKFTVDDSDGTLLDTAGNLELLRALWLGRTMVSGDSLGPGDPGDFDVGAWHVACHLLAGAGVRESRDKRLLWLEVSHDGNADRYYASVTVREGNGALTLPIGSADGRALLAGSRLLGFVEGASQGRTSSRFRTDPPDLFNLWRRQDFDQPPGSPADGGRVWEHWCTLRDIRPSHAIGTSVLTAYVSLVSALGDLFVPTVARGRRDYGHPLQLCAMVRAGLVGEKSATWPGMPSAIPASQEALFERADPATSLVAAAALDWGGAPKYYMFARKIKSWSTAADVAHDLQQIRRAP